LVPTHTTGPANRAALLFVVRGGSLASPKLATAGMRDAGGEREQVQRFAEMVDQLERRGLFDVEAFR
jgi:hypothetical protein